ncbi:MAG: BatD family protein, partial [Candidatus Omnitrophica bacterium]|nr:BatD family protein [Candidatus Omnitrophota bacterium]
NAKVLEQVIIPTSIDIKEVPSISFSYFDTAAKEYRTITKGPFSIIVTPPKKDEEFKAVGFESSRPVAVQGSPESVGKDIVYIKERLEDLHMKGEHFYQGILFWCLVVLYIILWFSAFGYYYFKRRLLGDPRFANKIQAPRNLHRGLEQAKGYVDHNNAKEFYSTVIKVIAEYVGSRLQMPPAGLSFEELSRLLTGKGVTDEIINDLRGVFETADKVRFASYLPETVMLKEDYKKINVIIAHLEKRL